MVACQQCAARFAASQEIEREWVAKHMARAHGDNRIARLGESERRERKPLPLTA